MSIFLVQHGKSLSKDQDPEQGLSPQGMDQVTRIAAVAQGYGVQVGSIVHSGKKRARQTAEIFTAALRPAGGVTEREGLGPLEDVVSFAVGLDAQSRLMVVGHLPFMERLTSLLITGDMERPVFKFQNGGIVCLDQGTGGTGWVIKWTLMPEIG